MRRATINRILRPLASQKAINQSRSERVSPADSIEYLQVLAHCRLVKFAVRKTDCSPVVHCCRLSISQRCGDNFEVRKVRCRALNHAMEIFDVDLRAVLVQSLYFQTEASGEILFVPKHDIH